MWPAIPAERTAEERREAEKRLTRAYTGQGDAMLKEIAELLHSQAWRADT
jgi:hypothetical protein